MSGLVRIETVEQWEALADAAQTTFDEAERCLLDVVTPDRCAEVRALRIGPDGTVWGSWRYVAGECYDGWGGSWSPPTNQLWGMALCKLAALAHGEDFRGPPWN